MKETKAINPKSYVLIKYLFTLTCIFLYIIPLVAFLHSIGKAFKNSFKEVEVALIIFTVVAVILAIAYISLRKVIHNKTDYLYVGKELTFNKLYFSFFITSLALTVINMIWFVVVFPNNANTYQVLWYVSYPLIVIFGILSSMFEARSRVNEQIHIYEVWDKDEKLKTGEVIEEKPKVKRTKKTGDSKDIEYEKTENPFLKGEDKDD